MQVHVSSRATAAVQLTSLSCRLVGARCRIVGIVSPESALDDLADTATVMSVNASYLAELVVTARRHGMGPDDFRLRRIDCVSEILSTAVRDAAELTFGAPVHDNFGLTEAIPVTATSCSAGHLHHDLASGHVEVLDLHTGRPAHAGDLGTLVVTPYFPYRECMPVFRYDTRDVVRVPHGTGECEQAGLPGTSQILGKAEQLIHLASGVVVTPRDVVEAIETLPGQSWPARFKATPEGDRIGLCLTESAARGLSRSGLVEHFAERGLAVSVTVVDEDQGPALRPVRSDLHELAFPAPVPVGA